MNRQCSEENIRIQCFYWKTVLDSLIYEGLKPNQTGLSKWKNILVYVIKKSRVDFRHG